MLAAGDTFRAAAIEQLKIWGERTSSPVVASKLGADAAGLAWDAYERAKTAGSDVLIIDTAGRLQNKAELMAELEKIVRVLAKHDPEAPHTVLQTVDATTGQNALNQVEIFRNVAGVNGLVMTARRAAAYLSPSPPSTGCRSISSASANRSTTSNHFPQAISPRPSPE
jgi:fused signal recognition particle receptor